MSMTKYNFSEIEKKWQDNWALNKTYKSEINDKPKYYVMDMFPYPSGSGLHVGHPLGYIASDIWYNWNRYYLDSEDNFTIAREKMLQVAYDLFPDDLSNYKTVSNAWASVGVGEELVSGDINNDTIINIQDVIMLIGYILGSLDLTQHQSVAADMNFDGIRNVLDVIAIINVILS